MMKKEIIGILICTLLIATAVAPVINALDNEVDIVKEPMFGQTDTDALEEIIDDLIIRFEDAQAQNEKIAILKEIPILMDMCGLLPEDMTVVETQELIVSSYVETMSSSNSQTEQSSVGGDNSLMGSKNVLLSSLPQLQVSESNQAKMIRFGFGETSDAQYVCPYCYVDCENVICLLCDDDEWHHFTDGERLWYHHKNEILGIFSCGIFFNDYLFILLCSCD